MNVMRRIAAAGLAVLLLVCVWGGSLVTVSAKELDVTELTNMMTAAQKLQQGDYTADSWNALDSALKNAERALGMQSQARIDAATRKIAEAFSKMVPIDFSKMYRAMTRLDILTRSSSETSDLWDKLVALYAEAEAAKVSGNQEEVDRIAGEIEAVIDAINGGSNREDAFDMSIIWMILFFISLLINAAFVALVMIRTRNIRKFQKDDVPLVEYDIDDDIE